MQDITQELVQELLDYDPDTGVFTWRKRDRKWFATQRAFTCWNTRYAGKPVTYTNHGYTLVSIFNKRVYAHRLAWLYMYGYSPKMIDHINRDKSDNRISNLRETDYSRNGLNSPEGTGVYKHSQSGKWTAQICVRGKRQHLGLFKTKDEALQARKYANKRN